MARDVRWHALVVKIVCAAAVLASGIELSLRIDRAGDATARAAREAAAADLAAGSCGCSGEVVSCLKLLDLPFHRCGGSKLGLG